MKRDARSVVLFLLLVASAAMAAPPPKAIVIAQPNSPIKITAYAARYNEQASGAPEGIQHSVAFTNTGTQKVVAVRFGFLSFDVFNEFLGKMGALDLDGIEPGESTKGAWVANHYGDFSFLTGIVYVDAVRLEDGVIWQADEGAILAGVRKVEKDFDAKLLRERDTPK